MFPSKKEQQQVNLAKYGEYIQRQRGRVLMPLIASGVVTCLGVGIAAAGFFGVGWPLGMAGAVVALVASTFGLREWNHFQRRVAHRFPAWGTAAKVYGYVQNRKLSRELDPASVVVLDEAARQWARIHAAYPETPGEPVVAVHVRRAADAGMEELLMLFRDHLNVKPANKSLAEMATETLESFGIFTRRDDRPPPAFFNVALAIAQKMQALAEEAERKRLAGESDLAAPGHSLDAALGELRAVREAETELQQELRH